MPVRFPGDSRVRDERERERMSERAKSVGRFFKGKARPSSTAGFALVGAAFFGDVGGEAKVDARRPASCRLQASTVFLEVHDLQCSAVGHGCCLWRRLQV